MPGLSYFAAATGAPGLWPRATPAPVPVVGGQWQAPVGNLPRLAVSPLPESSATFRATGVIRHPTNAHHAQPQHPMLRQWLPAQQLVVLPHGRLRPAATG